MSNYKCIHCEATAHSKCVIQRTVFPTNQTEAIVSHVWKRYVERPDKSDPDQNVKVHIVLRTAQHFDNNPDNHLLSDAEHYKQMITWLRDMLNEDFDTMLEWCCDHEWRITEGECLFGCCVAETVGA